MRVGEFTLVERSVLHAYRHNFDPIILTTDDPFHAYLSQKYDRLTICERDPELASDLATIEDVISDIALDHSYLDRIVLLQPTSPFRTWDHMEDCVKGLDTPPNRCISVHRSSPPLRWARPMGTSGHLGRPLDRSDLVMPTGSIYAFRVGDIRHGKRLSELPTRGVLAEPTHAIDIDAETDLIMAKALLSAGLTTDSIDHTERSAHQVDICE